MSFPGAGGGHLGPDSFGTAPVPFGGFGVVVAHSGPEVAAVVAQVAGVDLGAAGFLSPGVAAWLPAVVGSSVGTLALLYQEDG